MFRFTHNVNINTMADIDADKIANKELLLFFRKIREIIKKTMINNEAVAKPEKKRLEVVNRREKTNKHKGIKKPIRAIIFVKITACRGDALVRRSPLLEYYGVCGRIGEVRKL